MSIANLPPISARAYTRYRRRGARACALVLRSSHATRCLCQVRVVLMVAGVE